MTMQHLTQAKDYFDARFQLPHDDTHNYAPDLFSVLNALHWHGNSQILRDALPCGVETLGFTDFLNTMAYLGYAPKIVSLRKNKINPEMLPCLFVPQGAKVGEVLFSEADENIKGTAFIFRADSDGAEYSSKNMMSAAGSNVKWFTRLLKRFDGVFPQVLTASLVINLLTLVTPLFMMSVYDKVIGAHSPATLEYLLAGVLLAITVEFTLRFLRARSLSWFGARIDYIVSNAILERILALPASFTERTSVAAQLSRLKAFESVREFFTGSLFLSFIEFPFTLVLLVALAFIAGPLVVIPLIIAALYALLLIAMQPRLKESTLQMATATAERQNMNIETLSKQESLRSAGGFDAWIARFERISARSAFAGYKYHQAVSVIDTVSQGLLVLGGVAMIYFGVERIWAEQMSMGGMIAILILTWRILTPLQMTCTAVPRLGQVMRNIHQINRLMDLKPEYDVYQSTREVPSFDGDIEFHNVGLRYAKDAAPIYAGLSFKAKSGQIIAITGSNSTGKSTTLKLVSGLYHPQAGAVRIDGIDIRQIDPKKLRQGIAYVGQDPDFFTASIEDNLRLVKPDASKDAIKAAIHKAGLETWLEKLPDGLATLVGHGGITIQTGVRYQLALARAYLQDSKIILIDEMPYEFLNGEAGQYFYQFLQQAKGKYTVLFVTYRKDYIEIADQVIQLYQDERPQVKGTTNA